MARRSHRRGSVGWAGLLVVAGMLAILALACGSDETPEPAPAIDQSATESAQQAAAPADDVEPEPSAPAQADAPADAPQPAGAEEDADVVAGEAEETPVDDTPDTEPPPDATATIAPIPPEELAIDAFPVPAGSRPHDVAPAPDGGVWYTAQNAAALGWLDPASGETRHIGLGSGSRPHGVIVGPDGAAWVTDGGLNAIVRVDPATDAVEVYPLPADRPNANLNTAAFDGAGRLWFTGQNGIIGRFDPATGAMDVFDAPRGRGPYGITATPDGDIYFASLAGSYVGQVDLVTGAVRVLEPPTPGQGARRVWSDSRGRIWLSEWNAGQLAVYDPAGESWREWPLPGPSPQAYAVFVDEADIVWVSDFGGNAMHRFDPALESWTTFALPGQPGNVRQILGRLGEVWAPESAADQLIVIRRAVD